MAPRRALPYDGDRSTLKTSLQCFTKGAWLLMGCCDLEDDGHHQPRSGYSVQLYSFRIHLLNSRIV